MTTYTITSRHPITTSLERWSNQSNNRIQFIVQIILTTSLLGRSTEDDVTNGVDSLRCLSNSGLTLHQKMILTWRLTTLYLAMFSPEVLHNSWTWLTPVNQMDQPIKIDCKSKIFPWLHTRHTQIEIFIFIYSFFISCFWWIVVASIYLLNEPYDI